MLRFGLLMCVCLFFLGCALLFAFGSTGSPCFVPRGIRTLPGPRLSAANLSLSLSSGLLDLRVSLDRRSCTSDH